MNNSDTLLEAGVQIGSSSWTVIKPLGRGAFGIVVEVEHGVTHKRAACKVLQQAGTGKKGDVIRDKTLKAARLLAQIEHPNLPQIFDAGYLGEPPRNWVVMELLRGRELSEVLREEGPLLPARAVRYIAIAAAAVAMVAEKGVIHRDLKPDNLFITDRDILKVIDFDSAHMPTSQTMEGQITGTPYYMSPEHYQGKNLDSRTDVWALGIILYEMLVGTLPFQGANMSEIIAGVFSRALPPPPPDKPIPPAVWQLIERATQKRREDRFANISDFAAALQALSDSATGGATAPNYAATARLSSEAISDMVVAISSQQQTTGPGASSLAAYNTNTPPQPQARPQSGQVSATAAAIAAALGLLVVVAVVLLLLPSKGDETLPEAISVAAPEPDAVEPDTDGVPSAEPEQTASAAATPASPTASALPTATPQPPKPTPARPRPSKPSKPSKPSGGSPLIF